jgi:hypothetical protein
MRNLRRIVPIVLTAALMHATAATAQKAQPPDTGVWVGRSSKIPFTPMQLGRVTVDYPRKDWVTTPTARGTMLVMLHKSGEAWITLEHQTLQTALAPEDVTDLFAQLEADRLKAAEPQSAAMQTRLFNMESRRFTGVQFMRTGPKGPEVVREYAFPVGGDLYRLTCGTAIANLPKYEPVFAHIAASFRAQPAPETTQ